MTGHRVLHDQFVADHSIPDPGNAGEIGEKINRSPAVCEITTTASGETRTLADPTVVGQTLSLTLIADGGGNIDVTAASAVNQTGNTVMRFNDIGDYIKLEGIRDAPASYEWRVVANDDVTLA